MECYAQRTCNPFHGVLQIVSHQRARALSLDGVHWELQFQADLPRTAFLHQYVRVGFWHAQSGLKTYPVNPATANPREVECNCMPIVEHLPDLRLPLPQDDDYEWWLLDEKQKQPLALLATCRHPHAIPALTEHRPAWVALSAMQLPIERTPAETAGNLPPVNYRLETQVREYAGYNAVARWFVRNPEDSRRRVWDGRWPGAVAEMAFPALMLREQWDKPTEQDLYERYVQRLAPRLLALQYLPLALRDRLEQMAGNAIMELDARYPLYPEVANPERMKIWRVEARLRKWLEANRPSG